MLAVFLLGLSAQQQPQQQIQTVPLDFRQKIAATANAYKADNLAWGVLTVQNEVVAVQNDLNTFRNNVKQGSTDHEQRLVKLEKDETTIVQHIKALEDGKLDNQIAALQSQLNDFRAAACPALKTAKLKDTEKTNLEKMCQSDSTATK
jgi:cell division protein FtsB